MKVPSGPWLEMEETGSTQDIAAMLLESPECPGVIFTEHQLDGRGRFRRSWHSARGESLTYSLVFHDYAGHKQPWLIGMSVAVAIANVLDAQVQWPNDVVIGGKKVAGVLVELLPIDAQFKTPVVGVGVNVNQSSFPSDLDHKATSLYLERKKRIEPKRLGKKIIVVLAELPEPSSWSSVEPAWMRYDATPGKRYVLPSGEAGVALRIGPNGEMVCDVGGEERTVMAAEAMFDAS